MTTSNEPRKLFGTDGIRGRANDAPMTPETALAVGRAVAHIFKRTGHARPRIVIGKDTRLSNYMFESALQAGICSMGVDAVQLGVLPTPGIAFMTTGMRADAGVVISASHNPYDDNGIKFFGADGFKLPDDVELQIEQLLASGDLLEHRAIGSGIGKAYRIEDAVGRYVVFLKSTFPRALELSGIRIVIDCANGASYKVAPETLYELGAEIFPMGTAPNGTNINAGVGALHPERMAERVRELRADIGIALDGDADRCILCDERGNIVDGDAMLLVLARHMKEQGTLRNDTVVATVMSNLGLERALNAEGIALARAGVGDRYVAEHMLAGGFNLGGEQSGHLILHDLSTTGDGLLAALQVLAVMVGKGRPLSALTKGLERVPQILRSVFVTKKPPLEALPETSAAIRDVEGELGKKGRVLVRYSGTEAKCRVMVEGDDEARVNGYADRIAGALEREIGA
ncbi:MAG: phosphoglucosamine mutase [Myxococcales bacterium]|nr:phosphoglucosamine mutase [Myxococcales bacterium]MCB9733877.1 phosphoglucosamine mutase [Deltaproteobacteria bacterium]